MTISAHKVATSRLQMHVLDSGGAGTPVLFVHGNISSSAFYRRTLQNLPKGMRGIAPDLRGFGGSDPLPVDATRGLSDFSDDLHSLVLQLGLGQKRLFLCGWSLGGGVVMRYAIDHPEEVAGLVLLAPVSPDGFGGTRGEDGRPCWPDFAGSGAGNVSPEFVSRLLQKDRGSDSKASPRSIMNRFYYKPPFCLPPAEEEQALTAMLEMRVDDDHYPGDRATSPNWPGVAPGTRGFNNALSPKYCNLRAFVDIKTSRHPRPKVLWIRGADDQIVSDTSVFDIGFLGQVGAVPGWPGPEVYPPQPMVSQTRAVLKAYKEKGGDVQELVFSDCGHAPHLEKSDAFHQALHTFVSIDAPGRTT